MNKKTKLLFPLFFVIFSLLFFSIISVDAEISYISLNGQTNLNDVHPSDEVARSSSIGFVHKGINAYLGSVSFLMSRHGTSTSLLQVWVYACDVDNITIAEPTTTILAYSNLEYPNELPNDVSLSNMVWLEFMFTGSNNIYLYGNTAYFFAVTVIGGNIYSPDRYCVVGVDTGDNDDNANCFHFINGVWEDQSWDCGYIVKNTYEISLEGEDVTSIAISNYMVMFIFIFVPSMILAGWCYKSDYPPMVGFIAGLTLSVAIGLLVGLMPIWLLFICVIVIILLLFNMVRSQIR